MGQMLAAEPGSLSPLALFLQADWIVRAVLVLLLLTSIWTWTTIVRLSLSYAKIGRLSVKFERMFWQAKDIDSFAEEHRAETHPMAKALTAGLAEWRLSTAKKTVDREGTRHRLGLALASSVATDIDRMSDRLNALATIGAVTTFVGLFGTVWGIMRAFANIAGQQNTSLAAVAPGISEALFATAAGLFAAIPAVIGYNRLSHTLNRLEARLNRFTDGFHATLSRALEE